MEQIEVYVILVLLGLCLGSFAGATVWRLRAGQLVDDKAEGEKVDSKEYKKLLPLTKETTATDHSRCLHCGHALAWYDLLPLASWVSTGGRCRYCKRRIGWFEPAIEIGVASFFVATYVFWPSSLAVTENIVQFALWLGAGVLLAVLFAYDLKWFLLPDKIMVPLVAVGAVIATLQVFSAVDGLTAFVGVLGAVVILSGLYLTLWLVSKGQWIGFGDVKLGLALALLLADWKLALLALLTANIIGCFIVVPGILSGRMTRKTRVPFGPLLIAGGVFAFLFGRPVVDWYFALSPASLGIL